MRRTLTPFRGGNNGRGNVAQSFFHKEHPGTTRKSQPDGNVAQSMAVICQAKFDPSSVANAFGQGAHINHSATAMSIFGEMEKAHNKTCARSFFEDNYGSCVMAPVSAGTA